MNNDVITIEECISRLDIIRHELVSDSRDHFALSAGIAALDYMADECNEFCRSSICVENKVKWLKQGVKSNDER